MEDKHQVRLGAVQQTLFIPLAARAIQTQKKHPLLRDPKAVEMVRSIDYDAAKYGRGAGGWATVLRTAIIGFWVRSFLAAHPAGTAVEIGTGSWCRWPIRSWVRPWPSPCSEPAPRERPVRVPRRGRPGR